MAAPTAGKCIEQHLPIVKQQGLNTLKASNLAGFLVDTSGNVTAPGTLAVTGAITATGGVAGAVAATTITASSTLDVTGATTLGGAVNYKNQVTNTGGAYATPIVLTAAQSGRVLLVNDAAGLDFTLPAIGTAEIGTTYTFVVTTTITTNNFRVTAATGDLLNGAVWLADFDTANTGAYFAANGSTNLVVTCNGTTTGGKKGTWLTYVAISTTGWFVYGNMFGDGTLATPFSG